MDGLLEHLQAVVQVDRPEGLAPFGERIAAPDVVNEDVEALVPAFYSGDEFLNFGRNCVIHSKGNALAARGGDQFGGFFDGFGTAGCGGIFS